MNLQTSRRIRCTITSTGRITWRCDACGKPIKAKTGYVTVDRGKAMQQHWEADEREFQRLTKARAEGHSFTIISGTELLAWPGPVGWQLLHQTCDQNLERDDYWFGVERVDTLAKLLNWAAHLLEKKWLPETDWSHLLHEAAAAAGGADA